MMKVVLIGTGNVAKHLFNALLKCDDIAVLEVVGRTTEKLSYFKQDTTINTNPKKIQDADIYIIVVSDDAISAVSRHLIAKQGLVMHTSGSIPMEALSDVKRKGVFYPLQTFREGQKVNFKTIPICIEATQASDLAKMSLLANAISDHVHEINSAQRKYLHLAAVFVNNFTNHMYHIGQEICTTHQLPFSILHPLLLETAEKIKEFSPYNVQTGPAKRKDKGTLEKQKALLENDMHKNIYTLLSQSIQKTYGEKL
ncbi:Rossmann-like and DUF2520 domain-containing protein [Spongiimicrobium salis]|uniref:Rossmann-like and DUF2520 domain-containing protein n=1 Tax=Spongiimicrobium salis TaxID=1667022 RepID=UPI00374C9A24